MRRRQEEADAVEAALDEVADALDAALDLDALFEAARRPAWAG